MAKPMTKQQAMDLLRERFPAQAGLSGQVVFQAPEGSTLADPVNRGRVCTRSGSHPYNLSLFGAMAVHLGDANDGAAAWWATGRVTSSS